MLGGCDEAPAGGASLPVAGVAPDDADLARGFDIWSVLCASCHGDDGKGRGGVSELLTEPPPDLTDTSSLAFPSPAERRRVIAEGVDGTAMVGWRKVLDDEEIGLVDAYLAYLQGGA